MIDADAATLDGYPEEDLRHLARDWYSEGEPGAE